MASTANEIHAASVHRVIWVLLLLALQGCQSEKQVLVSIENWPSGTDALKVRTSLNGDAGRILTVHKPAQGFVIELPPEPQGELALDAQALDQDGCELSIWGQTKHVLNGATRFPKELSLRMSDPQFRAPIMQTDRPDCKSCIAGGWCWHDLSHEYYLTGVWGSGPKDVWAVGRAGTLLHWDGADWSAVSSGTNKSLYAIWGSGPNDVWAVGGAATILHFDGSAWSAVRSIDPDSPPNSFLSVWGSGPKDVWAVGNISNSAMHWNGSAWSLDFFAPTPVSGALNSVWGSGPSNAWIVDDAGRLLHFDGSAWAENPAKVPKPLTSIFGSGPADVWAVGPIGRTGTVLHFDGRAWSGVSSGTDKYLWSGWSSGPADVWAVGDVGTVMHFDGSAWSLRYSNASPALGDNDPASALRSVWGSSSKDVWAVGDRGVVLHFTPPR